METTVSKGVSEIPDDARRGLESLLGGRLEADQRVVVMVYTPGAVPDEASRRQAVASLQATFRKIDAHVAASGISPEEIEAAIDEAMEHVRPRKV